jgi:hypothetical protein
MSELPGMNIKYTLCTVLYWYTWPVWLYGIFPLYLINGMYCNPLKMSVSIFSATFVETFLILRTERDVIVNVHGTSNTIQYNTLRYDKIRYNTIRYSTIRYDTINTIQYYTINTIPYDTIQYNTVRYNMIRYSTIQYDTIQYNAIRYNTVPYDKIQ